jgi:hypothetical protein
VVDSELTGGQLHWPNQFPVESTSYPFRRLEGDFFHIGTLYRRLLLLHVVALFLGNPYGFRVIGDYSVRVSDLTAVATCLVGIFAMALAPWLRLPWLLFLPVLVFLAFEAGFPVIGSVTYGGPADALSGARIFLLYAPFLLAGLVLGRRFQEFDRVFARIVAAFVVINLLYAILQILIRMGLLPSTLLVTAYLEPWAVDPFFRVVDGFRASGFFVNTTALSVFAVLAMAFFLARSSTERAAGSLVTAGLALVLLMLTLSRAAIVAGTVILITSLALSSMRHRALAAGVLGIMVGAVYLAIDHLIGFDQFFARVALLTGGVTALEGDRSFTLRVTQIWPAVLEQGRSFTHGTLISPSKLIGLVDSGYLTYYLQGRWPMTIALVVFLAAIGWVGGLDVRSGRTWAGPFLLYTFIFLFGAMLISRPLHSWVLVMFVINAWWTVYFARTRRVMPIDHGGPAGSVQWPVQTLSRRYQGPEL